MLAKDSPTLSPVCHGQAKGAKGWATRSAKLNCPLVEDGVCHPPAKVHAIRIVRVTRLLILFFNILEIDRQRPGSTTGNPGLKSTSSTNKSDTALASPTVVISRCSIASASVRCPKMTLSNTLRVVVTVVTASGTVLPMIEVSAPCSRVDVSDSRVSVNCQLITMFAVPARGPSTRVPR
jgi:hypothetical protein